MADDILDDSYSRKILFQGDRIPGTVDAPKKEKKPVVKNDTARTLWTTSYHGPKEFPVIGETRSFWVVAGQFNSMVNRRIEKNPHQIFEDWNQCWEQCKEDVETQLHYAQKKLEKAQQDYLTVMQAQIQRKLNTLEVTE